MADHPLLCIVTGMEHSGTTFLARSICRLRGVRSGFECGVLLASSPRQFHRCQPFYDWMCAPHEHGHWGLSRQDLEHCCDTDSFAAFYRRVHRLSPACTGRWLIDKAPGYVFHLDQVMAHSDVPVLITHKDIYLMYRSYGRRVASRPRLLRLLAFVRRYLRYRSNVRRWYRNPRVMLVDHSRLAREPEVVMREVCAFLGVDCELERPVDTSNRPIRADYDIERELDEAHMALNRVERWLLSGVEFRFNLNSSVKDGATIPSR